jgi:hypothetical protein
MRSLENSLLKICSAGFLPHFVSGNKIECCQRQELILIN